MDTNKIVNYHVDVDRIIQNAGTFDDKAIDRTATINNFTNRLKAEFTKWYPDYTLNVINDVAAGYTGDTWDFGDDYMNDDFRKLESRLFSNPDWVVNRIHTTR